MWRLFFMLAVAARIRWTPDTAPTVADRRRDLRNHLE